MLSSLNEQLSREIAGTLNQIDQRSSTLRTMIADAGETFHAVETALTSGVENFQTALGDVTREVKDVGANADTTIASARALYENISRQQQSLASAAGELARSQAELDRGLDERRASLQALLTSVESRRTDLDDVMRAFSSAIEESFERVEGRAREIGAFLAETSQATTGLVERQFGDIRTAMGNERTHTASLLRAAYEQANEEIDSIFAQSTERFQGAAAEVRGLAPRSSASSRRRAKSCAAMPWRCRRNRRAGGGDAPCRGRSDQGAERIDRCRRALGPLL